MSQEVVAIGEVLWDLLPSGKVLGGAPCNFGYRLTELGHSVAVVSKVGQDELGEELLSGLQKLGVPTQWIQQDEINPTGVVEVELNEEGNPRYTIIPGVAYDFIEYTDELERIATKCKVICFGTLVQRSPVTRDTLYRLLDKATQAEKVLDINLRKACYNRETVEESLRRATILKLNRSEVTELYRLLGLKEGSSRQFAETVMSEYGIHTVLITLGEEGVEAYNRDGEYITAKAYKVTVVDSIGAGDSFTAGFVSKLLSGASLEECCQFGNATGALAATRKGGMSPIGKREIVSLLEDISASAC